MLILFVLFWGFSHTLQEYSSILQYFAALYSICDILKLTDISTSVSNVFSPATS